MTYVPVMELKNTFVLVAEDCPATTGIVPSERGGKPTIASLEYELLSRQPYVFTRDDLLVEVHLRRMNLSAAERAARSDSLRAELLSRPHPCMRASPLPKSYGWGVHHDGAGRIALVALGSKDYARLAAAEDLTIVRAMRNRRG